jgi:hypothetical protein
MSATTLRCAHPLRGYATTASSQATSRTSALSPGQPTVSTILVRAETETDATQLSSAITVKALVTFRRIARPCASADKLPVAIATPADNLDISLETARIRTPHHRLPALLPLEVALAEGSVDEEASKVVAASTLQPTEPRRATSVVGQTTMREIARRRP